MTSYTRDAFVSAARAANQAFLDSHSEAEVKRLVSCGLHPWSCIATVQADDGLLLLETETGPFSFAWAEDEASAAEKVSKLYPTEYGPPTVKPHDIFASGVPEFRSARRDERKSGHDRDHR